MFRFWFHACKIRDHVIWRTREKFMILFFLSRSKQRWFLCPKELSTCWKSAETATVAELCQTLSISTHSDGYLQSFNVLSFVSGNFGKVGESSTGAIKLDFARFERFFFASVFFRSILRDENGFDYFKTWQNLIKMRIFDSKGIFL